MENELVVIDPKEYGLDELKAERVKAVFMPMIEKMKELEIKYREIIALPVEKETCKKAKELRLQYVRVRTGTEKIHKDAKAAVLAEGKFIDGWKNTQLHLSEGIEAKLQAIETHYERIEAEQRANLQKERVEAYRPYSPFPEGTPDPDFSNMPAEIWNNFLTGAKKTYEDKLAATKKAEDDRIAKEKAEAEARAAAIKADEEERERIRLENEKLKKEAEEKEKQRQVELKAAATERNRIEIEHQAKLETERKEQAEKLAAERKVQEEKRLAEKKIADEKLAAEQKAAQVKLDAERKEREKVEAELKAKEVEEQKRIAEIEKIKKEKEAADKKALNAPDKEKLLTFSKGLLAVKIPEISTEHKEARAILCNAVNILNRVIRELQNEAGKL
jgi:hypothetical protein